MSFVRPRTRGQSLTTVGGLFGILTLGITTAQGAVTYAVGDLLLGFHSAAGEGSGTSFVVNLGSAAAFKDAPGTMPAVPALGPVLTSTFGANWFSRTDLYWGMAAVRDAAAGGPNTVVSGDPKATIYISRTASEPGASEPWSLASGSTVISVATSIATMQGASGNDLTLPGGFEGSTEAPGTNGRGTLQNEGVTINSWDEFNPIGGNAFGNILTGGVQGNTSSYLDLYRVVGRPNNASVPNTPAGQGEYVTSFALDAAGKVRTVRPASSVPETNVGWLSLGLTWGGLLLWRARRTSPRTASPTA